MSNAHNEQYAFYTGKSYLLSGRLTFLFFEYAWCLCASNINVRGHYRDVVSTFETDAAS